MTAHGIMFHHFHGGLYGTSQGSISAEQLDQMLVHVGLHRILPAREWYERSLADTLEPHHLCLTFDDALRCQYEIAWPVLHARGLTAFWFVYSSVFEGNIEFLEIYRNFRHECFESIEHFYRAFEQACLGMDGGARIEDGLRLFDPADYDDFPFYTLGDRRFRFLRDRILGPTLYHAVMETMLDQAGYDRHQAARKLWMDDDALVSLHRHDNMIGLHSFSHPTDIAGFSVSEQEQEYRRNADHLVNLLGEMPTTVGHPCNSYNSDTLALLAKMGIKLGFRANMAMPQPPSRLEFPRIDHAVLAKELGR